MATPQYYGLNSGESAQSAVSQNTNPTKDCVIYFELENVTSQVEAIRLIEEIKKSLLQGHWPPQ